MVRPRTKLLSGVCRTERSCLGARSANDPFADIAHPSYPSVVIIKALKVATDLWRAETAFDQGQYVEAYRAYDAVHQRLKSSGKATFDVDLKAAMAAHNAGLIDDARNAYNEARKGVVAATDLSSDNRNYLLTYIDHWVAVAEGRSVEKKNHSFGKSAVKKRWLSEFPIDW